MPVRTVSALLSCALLVFGACAACLPQTPLAAAHSCCPKKQVPNHCDPQPDQDQPPCPADQPALQGAEPALKSSLDACVASASAIVVLIEAGSSAPRADILHLARYPQRPAYLRALSLRI